LRGKVKKLSGLKCNPKGSVKQQRRLIMSRLPGRFVTKPVRSFFHKRPFALFWKVSKGKKALPSGVVAKRFTPTASQRKDAETQRAIVRIVETKKPQPRMARAERKVHLRLI